MSVVSKNNCLQHYKWGSDCDGWVLADTPGLSVKHERMPPQTAETLHYHAHAQQFFFMLKGTASFEAGILSFTVAEGEGLHIRPGVKHRIINQTEADIEFLVSSQPSTNQDRID